MRYGPRISLFVLFGLVLCASKCLSLYREMPQPYPFFVRKLPDPTIPPQGVTSTSTLAPVLPQASNETSNQQIGQGIGPGVGIEASNPVSNQTSSQASSLNHRENNVTAIGGSGSNISASNQTSSPVSTVASNITQPLNITKVFNLHTSLKANWFKSYHFCIWNKMRLASIQTKDEFDLVKKQIRGTGFPDSFWIGGTKLGNGQYFYWYGNYKPITFSNWSVDDPDPNNNTSSSDCVAMRGPELEWKTVSCDEQNFFVCESDIP